MGHDTGSHARGQEELASLIPWALAFLRKLGARDDEAADIAQEGLLAALESWSTFDPERGTLRGWVAGILKNDWLNYLQWRRARREVPLSAEDESLVRPSHEGAVMARDTLRFLSTSTPSERWSVIVARAEGWTGFEAARQERVCAKTGYDRVRRGRLDLAAAMAREDTAAAGPMVRRGPRSKP